MDKENPKNHKNTMISSYDVVGDIAIVEIPEGKQKQKKQIARSIIDTHSHIKTVMEKKGDRFGEFRLRELKPIIGKETVTEHHESGCRFRLDVTQAYFSPREGTERSRIADQVKPGETVLVMFAGVGPFAVVIGRKQPKVKKVYAVEINPDAVKWMEENVVINKLKYVVEPILGDAKDKCEKLYGKCSRIVMPLPHESRKFLSTAIKCIKPKGIIHFYYVGPEQDMFKMAGDVIKMECTKLGRKCRTLKQQKVLPYGPRMYKVCIDFEVL
jgi:tRNA (guanine37-N1)-methyltransferase